MEIYEKDKLAMAHKRNAMLALFFHRYGYEVRIIGDPHKPMVVWNNEYVLSLHIDNFKIKFCKEPFSKEHVLEIKLNNTLIEGKIANLKIKPYPIHEAIMKSKHQKVWKIEMIGYGEVIMIPIGLYLTGWNYTNQETKQGRYPVWSINDPKVYLNKDNAIEVMEEFKEQGYLINIV